MLRVPERGIRTIEDPKRTDWKKFALFGCGCLLVLALGVGTLVALNWKKVSGFVSETTGALSELYSVQRVLQEKYPECRISVQMKSVSNVAGKILSVKVEDAPFLADFDLAGGEARDKALEIAACARDALPKGNGYAHYEVVFQSGLGGMIRVSHAQTFPFEASALPPPAPR